MKFNLAAMLALLLCITVSAFAKEDQKAAQATYAELAAKVKAGDLRIDWQALRVAAVIADVEDKQDFQAVKDGYAAVEAGKFDDGLKIARRILDHDIANIDAHLQAWRALEELGHRDEAEKERAIGAALLQSITESGDGKSANTAWFAATIREEYLFMQFVLGVQFEAQHSMRQGEHYYDVVTVKDQSGKERTLWFNTDTDFRRMQIITDRYGEKT